MSTWISSDTHFNHTKIIEYCSRPFSDISNMNEVLISNWDSIVAPGDLVYHIGDFAMGDKNQIPTIRKRLNGKIVLILGNHDYKHNRRDILPSILSGGFDELHTELYVEIDGIKVYLRHEPKMDFQPSDEAQYHLCGHVHGSWTRKGNIINVGVDVHNYKPISILDAITSPEIIGASHRGY